MLIEIVREGAIARVWLNRPEQHNALVAELGAALVEALAHARRTTSCARRGARRARAVVLRRRRHRRDEGLGERHVRGEPRRSRSASAACSPRSRTFRSRWSRRIHGNVLGGGVGLGCACDIAVAAATLEVRAHRGAARHPAGAHQPLRDPPPRRSRRARADAHRRALRRRRRRCASGSSTTWCRRPSWTPRSTSASRRCSRAPAGRSARIKTLLELWADSRWEEYRAALPRTLAEVRAGDEAKDGLAAFFEKRKPRWRSARIERARRRVPQGPDRQPRRDRLPHRRHAARDGHPRRSRSTPRPTAARCTRASPTRRSRIGPAEPRASYLERRGADRARRSAAGAEAIHPGLRLPRRERGVRRGRRGRGAHVHRPDAGADPRDGRQARGARARRSRPACRSCPGAEGADAAALATRGGRSIGYPVMVKAALGGGGKGMRVVATPGRAGRGDRERARGWRASAFGDGAVYLEKRHRARRATSRCRCSATARATRSTCSSASARSSAATRR